VVRCDSNDDLQDSAPCKNCLCIINELNIKRLIFSSKNNTFISINPKLLNINHVTAGNKFIKFKEDKENKENKENKYIITKK
tara:strand:- start:852 stop:1097 length:246 start_codon:yes stop_codon:yes gene_type:complete